MRRRILNLAVLVCLVVPAGGYAFVSRDFGAGNAALLALLLALPLVVAVRLRCRSAAVRGREMAFLAVLFCVTAGGGAFVVAKWYADGLHQDHNEDVKWAEFEKYLRRDPAFQDVQVRKSERKRIYWLSGIVNSEDDLARLPSIAAAYGIERRRLDGPFAHSVSLIVRGPAETRALIASMTDPQARWEERRAAEGKLARAPAHQVMPALLPHLEDMPQGGIWNSGGFDLDKRAPIEWQTYYAVSRSWDNQAKKLNKEHGGPLLHDLLRKASSARTKVQLLRNLLGCWTADAEPTVVSLLKDENESLQVRLQAGMALALEGHDNYQDFLLRLATDSDQKERERWYDILVDPRYRKRRGMDPRVVLLGFDQLADRRRSPGSVHGSYFLALHIGSYVGQQFQPDQQDPQYRTADGGLKEAFFEDTVKNALDWWKKHKDMFSISYSESLDLFGFRDSDFGFLPG